MLRTLERFMAVKAWVGVRCKGCLWQFLRTAANEGRLPGPSHEIRRSDNRIGTGRSGGLPPVAVQPWPESYNVSDSGGFVEGEAEALLELPAAGMPTVGAGKLDAVTLRQDGQQEFQERYQRRACAGMPSEHFLRELYRAVGRATCTQRATPPLNPRRKGTYPRTARMGFCIVSSCCQGQSGRIPSRLRSSH